MAYIELNNATVDFPVYNATSRSLKNSLIKIATGGKIEKNEDGVVVVRGLDGVSVSLADGDRIGIIGHNGSGKTTMLRLLSGVYEPTGGTATVSGSCASLINISLGIDPEATGRDNIRLRAAMMGLGAREIQDQIEELGEFTGLGEFLDMPLRTYSTGMAVRLAFTVSTAIRPDILIMDEWLSTGDEDFRDKADQRLSDLVGSTKILVVATHDRSLIERNCNRILWLEHGTLKMDGPVDEIAPLYFTH